MAPRIAPIVPGTRPELASIEASIKAERGHINLLYQVLLNSAPLSHGWEKLLTAVRNHNSIPADLREMVMVRVAVLNRAPYEIDAHLPLALTDAMTRDVQVPDAIFEPLRAHFDTRALLELVATVAAYNMVSRLLEALQIGH